MKTIYLDASALKLWSDCRELYRQSQVLNRTSWPPNIHYQYGIAIHSAVESFWKGEPYEKAMDVAYAVTNAYPVALLNPSEVDTWKRLVTATPDLVACYYDNVDYSPENLLWNETEWSITYCHLHGVVGDNKVCMGCLKDGSTPRFVILCGRMDRLLAGPRLVDVKTASEIARAGLPWKQAYREEKLLDFQFGLYDWFLCESGTPPIECYLEVLLKPYGSKKARLERIDLPEIVSEGYRRRFRQQLAWKVSEVIHYVENYSSQAPWPLNGGSACNSKFGRCSFHEICTFGETPRTMKHITLREPHLKCVKEAQEIQKDNLLSTSSTPNDEKKIS